MEITERYKVSRSTLVITKPDGTVVEREIELYLDFRLGTVGVRFVGESQLKGYCFDLIQREIDRVRECGEPLGELRPISLMT